MINESLEQATLIIELEEVVASLPKRDNIFAGKMLVAYKYFGKLTPAQKPP
jgi:uncharacterized membrane protein